VRRWRESPQKSVYNFSLKSRREGRIEKYNNKNGVIITVAGVRPELIGRSQSAPLPGGEEG
jgi:hypothetical protein